MEKRMTKVENHTYYEDALIDSLIKKDFEMVDYMLVNHIADLSEELYGQLNCFCALDIDIVKENIIYTFARIFEQKEIDVSEWMEPADVIKYIIRNNLPIEEEKLSAILDNSICDYEMIIDEYHIYRYKVVNDTIYLRLVYENYYILEQYEKGRFRWFDKGIYSYWNYDNLKDALEDESPRDSEIEITFKGDNKK